MISLKNAGVLNLNIYNNNLDWSSISLFSLSNYKFHVYNVIERKITGM